MTERTYAVLLSTASEAGPDFVTAERFNHPVIASCYGQQIKLATGLEYEVMEWTREGWRNAWGESPTEVIRKRWAARDGMVPDADHR